MWHIPLISLLVVAGSTASVEVRTLDGASQQGTLVELTAEQAVVEAADGRRSVPVSELMSIAPSRAAQPTGSKPTLTIELVDQSRIAAVGYEVNAQMATIKLDADSVVKLPTRAIQTVRFQAPTASLGAPNDPLVAQWSEIVGGKLSGDRLVVRKGDAVDFLEGVLGPIDNETITFKVDEETIPVKRVKVEGLVYFHPDVAEIPDAACIVSDARGSRLTAKSVTFAEGTLHVVTPGGLSMNLPLDSVTLDYSAGKIRYLSDLAPESVRVVPFFTPKHPLPALVDAMMPRRDVGFDQSPLRLNGKTYRKGLSLRSQTTAVYRLPGQFRQFKATVGIDDSVREVGSAIVQIKGDDKSLWQQTISGAEPAKVLELDIAGVKRLEIYVDYGAGFDAGDYVDLAEARVIK